MVDKPVSLRSLQRLPVYWNYLKSLPSDSAANISATSIAKALDLNDVQVRKDLAIVSGCGRPRTGYAKDKLIFDIECYLGYNDMDTAVLVGAGYLGRALLFSETFSQCGLNIIVAFDNDENLIGTSVNNKIILSADKITNICSRMKVKIGIITVPETQAQKVCDALIDGGILAIWNFASVHLAVPKNILVKNENMASSLAILSKQLKEKLRNSKL